MKRSGPQIDIPSDRLAEFCRKHGVRKLSFFGSVLREDFTPDSDVDVLVEFQPDRVPGLIRFCGMEMELSEILHREIDLHTPKSLSPFLRDRVLSQAQLQF